MSRIRPGIVLALAVLIITVIGVTLLTYLWLAINPEKFGNILASRIQQRLGKEVSVGAAAASLRRGPELTMRGVMIGKPGTGHIAVETLRARISIPRLFLGRINVTQLTLLKPRAAFNNFDPFLLLAGANGDLPALAVQGGSLILNDGSIRIAIDNIEGTLTQDSLRCEASLLGGTGIATLSRKGISWEGVVDVNDFDLAEVHPALQGKSNARLRVDGIPFSVGLAGTIETVNIRLPWCKGELSKVESSFTAHIDSEGVNVGSLKLHTPILSLSGSILLSPFDLSKKEPDAWVKAAFQASECRYESVVDVLPLDRFPDWLSRLLGEQIRNGTVHLTTLNYEGTLAGLASEATFLAGLRIEGALSGLSFGAGHDDNRIDSIDGRVELSGATLSFFSLSGRAGSSRIDEVDLKFHNITKREETELSVNVGLDMELPDFITAWRAAMTHQEIYELLEPCSRVRSGRIKCFAGTYYDPAQPGPVRMAGRVLIEGGSFYWNDLHLDSVNSRALKESFEMPLDIKAAGYIGGLFIDSLDISMPRPFADEPYDLSFVLSPIPGFNEYIGFTAGSKLTFRGTGTAGSLEGGLSLLSEGILVNGKELSPVEGRIEGQGVMRAHWVSPLAITVENFLFTSAPGRLVLNGTMEGERGRWKLEGGLDLALIQGHTLYPASGTVAGEVRLTMGESKEDGEEVLLDARLNCDAVRFFYGNETIGIDGPVVINTGRAATPGLSLRYRDLSIALSGEYSWSEQPFFDGTIEIDNLVLDDAVFDPVHIPDGLKISADIILRRSLLHGVPVEIIRGHAELDGGTLRIDDLDCRLSAGQIGGMVRIESGSSPSFDLDFTLKDKDLSLLRNIFSSDYAPLDGRLMIEGRIWGGLDNLNGDVVFEATQGRLLQYSLVSKIFTVTNLYRLASSERSGFTEEGFNFDTIKATLAIRDGVVFFEDFYLESPSIQASAVGSYDTKERTIDAVAGIQPLETIDRIISLVPLVNWIILGEEKRLIVLSLKVQGSADNPSISLAPLDTISRPITGILLRTLRLPLDIIIKPEVIIPGMP